MQARIDHYHYSQYHNTAVVSGCGLLCYRSSRSHHSACSATPHGEPIYPDISVHVHHLTPRIRRQIGYDYQARARPRRRTTSLCENRSVMFGVRNTALRGAFRRSSYNCTATAHFQPSTSLKMQVPVPSSSLSRTASLLEGKSF